MEPVRQIVKRPNETIGIVPNGKQRITQLVRRLYSVILLFSQQQGEREEYSAVLADMLAVAHSSGSNRAQVKEVLRDIRAIGVDWNVRDGEREVWKNVGLIEEPGLIDGRGTPTIVTWKLPKIIRARLLDPRGFFTRISLEMMTRLRSGASIALYEICCQYVSNDHGRGEGGLTNRAPIAEWMPRLTGSRKTTYEYKFLKRDVLLTAIEEINEITDLRVELVEHKIGRKVGELQFRVFRKEIIDSTRGLPMGVAAFSTPLHAVDGGRAATAKRTAAAATANADANPDANADEGEGEGAGAGTGRGAPQMPQASAPARRPTKTQARSAKPAALAPSLFDFAADADPPQPASDLPDGLPAPAMPQTPAMPPATAAAGATPPPDTDPILQRMLALGAPLPTARRLYARHAHDPAYLARHLDFVENRVRSTASAPLVNTVAFLQKALDHGYAEAAVPAPPARRSGPATAVKAPASSRPGAKAGAVADTVALSTGDAALVAQRQEDLLRRAEVWARFQSLPNDAEKAALVDTFLEQTGATLKTFYRKNGVNNMIVKASLTDWLIRERNF